MKHTIEFNLDPDNEHYFQEKRELKSILSTADMEIFIWDIYTHIKNEIKYNENLSDDSIKTLEELKEFVLEELEDKHLSYILD